MPISRNRLFSFLRQRQISRGRDVAWAQTIIKAAMVCFLAAFIAAANAATPRVLRFEQVNATQGLASDSIIAMSQDREGFMWFGGQSGLTRYDGYTATVYKNNPTNPHSLASNWVWTLYTDEQGRLWIGTRQGLHLYDKENDNFISYRPGNPGAQDASSLDVRSIAADGHGGLWLGTMNGLQHFDPATQQFSIMRHVPNAADSLVDNSVVALVRDQQGRLWIGTRSGLDCLPPQASSFQHYRLDDPANPDAKHNWVRSLLVDHEGLLWIGTGSANGLEAWQIGSEVPKKRRFGDAENLHVDAIRTLYEDRQNNLWLAENRGGLIHWDSHTNRFSTYAHDSTDPHSLAENAVINIYQDRSGTLWVGTWGSGASKVDLAGTGFARYIPNSGTGAAPGSTKISHILTAANGSLWLGTSDGGLRLWNPGTGETVDFRHDPKDPDSLRDDFVHGIAFDANGQLWIAGSEGMSLLDPATHRLTRHMPADGEPPGTAISDIMFDRSGMLWAMSAGGFGLYRFDPSHNTWRKYRHKDGDANSLANDSVFSLHEDREGTIWIGTAIGLDRLDRDGERFTHFDLQPKGAMTPGGQVSTIFEDPQGSIWIGSINGLSRMEKGADGTISFRLYPTPATVDSIVQDDNKHLWLSTDAGISCFDRATGTFRHYASHDDTIERSYYNGSAVVAPDGTIYFGGGNGLTAFVPDKIHDNPVVPQVLVTDFQIFNKSVRRSEGTEDRKEDAGQILPTQIQYAKALTLSYKDSVFSFEFAALHFADPKRNKFAYQLEGFDKDWVYTDAKRRVATYTNLDPGHYVFRVKAANKDGIWNEDGASIDVTITPPFWKTWWFRCLVAILLLGAAIAAYRSRIRGLIRQQADLEEQVDIRTVEIMQQKKLIEERNTELEKANDALALAKKIQDEQQSELTRFLAVASHDLRQPMHALNIYLEALLNVDLPDAARPFLSNVRKCAHVMDEMFLALLDLSRLDARVVQPCVRPFPIAAVLARLDIEFTPQAELKGLGLHFDLCAEWVESDPGLVEQILRNLLANAVRYTNSGRITVSCSIDKRRLQVAVKDTGIGISPEQQKTVFEEFCQIGAAGRDKGLGLGLAIVKRLSILLGAPVILVSAPGQGSTFTLDLPLSDEQAQASPQPRAEFTPNQRLLYGKLVVVIDDEENILNAMQALLEQWGCLVVAASSQNEATRKLRAIDQKPDALICDYRLRQGEHGLDAIDALQAAFGKDVPAVLITGDTSPAVIQEIQSSGLLALHKPVEAGTLIGLLAQILE